jgi:hypothetical protein
MTDGESIFLSAPAVARLVCLERSRAFRRIQSGDFGLRLRRGRNTYVELSAIEKFTRSKFTKNQIALAVGNVPTRRLTIPQMQEAE